jgi:serine protease inhibitor
VSKLDPLTALVAINVIYFKDLWRTPFSKALIQEAAFHTSDGQRLNVPRMLQNDSYPYYEQKTFQAVCLPYQTGRIGMYVFLPSKKSSLAEFLQHLDSMAWDECTKHFETLEGTIGIPRFKMDYGVDLKDPLTKLGMGIAFDPQLARFDAIHTPPPEIWIDEVRHRASIEVAEDGTEAAAITWGLAKCFSSESAKRPRTFEMIIDRPFFFAICNLQTDTILFMGCIEEPSSSEN